MEKTKPRERIGFHSGVRDIILKLAEGNPGALSVCNQMIEALGPVKVFGGLLDLDDMNMRGPQIWVAYKDHCGEDIELLIMLSARRDSALVETVNKECSGSGHIAVTVGGSHEHK